MRSEIGAEAIETVKTYPANADVIAGARGIRTHQASSPRDELMP